MGGSMGMLEGVCACACGMGVASNMSAHIGPECYAHLHLIMSIRPPAPYEHISFGT